MRYIDKILTFSRTRRYRRTLLFIVGIAVVELVVSWWLIVHGNAEMYEMTSTKEALMLTDTLKCVALSVFTLVTGYIALKFLIPLFLTEERLAALSDAGVASRK